MSASAWSLPLALTMSVAAMACGGSSRSAATIAPAAAAQDSNLGLEELRKSLESTVLENYVQLSYGNMDSLLDGVAKDRNLQLAGVTPRDVLLGPNPPGLHKDRRLYRRRIVDGLRILSKNLDVHLSADGSVGWIYDEFSYRVLYMGREASIPIRVTGVYVRDVERWILVAEHMSYGVAIDDIVALRTQGKLVAGKDFKSNFGTAKELSAYLIGLIGGALNKGLQGTPSELVPELLVLMPAAEQEFHGQGAVDAAPLAASFGADASIAVREFQLQLAPSKRLAWVFANLVVKTQRNGDAVEIPLRGSFVLERRKDRDWSLMQMHISAALLERQLSERVFGPAE